MEHERVDRRLLYADLMFKLYREDVLVGFFHDKYRASAYARTDAHDPEWKG